MDHLSARVGPPLVPHPPLRLPQVTLCAVTSVNVAATLSAMEACIAQVAFADCLLLTDAPVQPAHPAIRVVQIDRIGSSAAYSDFLLFDLGEYVATSHCLVVQWDGHLIDARRWRSEFLDYDYIGAAWPQFDDGHDVGNGGFSLRSRRLMDACREPGFRPFHPEDVAIGRLNRDWLEDRGLRFPPRALADLFSAERAGDLGTAFGYHGVFNMPRAVGVDAFWALYGDLDNRGTIKPDFMALLWSVARGPHGISRAARMIADHWRSARRK